jgi:hypothetical protein
MRSWLNQPMSQRRLLRIASVAAYLFMVVMNVLATTLPLNGQSTDEISDRYDTLFAPIGFTFAIWGVIYLLLGVYSVYQLFRTNAWVDSITPWYIASSVLNGVWIIAWHYEQLWAALLIIIGLLVTLIRINKTTTSARAGWAATVAVRLPFAVYFGWVTVATVANTSALLVQWGWRGGNLLSEEGWTIFVLIVAAAIGSTVVWTNRSPAFGMVLVWAFFGIYSRHTASDEWNAAYPGVILSLQILLPVLAVGVVIGTVRWLKQPLASPTSTPLKGAAGVKG